MAKSDDEMTFSNRLYGNSPCREGDESSVDIYDGLDSTPTVSISNSSEVTLSTTGLNLFDEILIEEGTAKEATYKDLQAEHEKCQQQLQDFIKRVKEIQEQNSALQNENQSLKKNISALIKTARVEIKRKDDEINNLQRRLSEIASHQNTRQYFPGSTSTTRSFEGSKAKNKLKDILPDNNSKTDSRTKQAVAPTLSHSYLSWNPKNKKFHSETRRTSYIPQSDPEQLYTDAAHPRLVNISGSCDEEKKKEIKNSEHNSRENNFRCESKAQQNPDGLLDAHKKLQVNSQKTDRNGQWKINKDFKLKNNLYTEKQTDKGSSDGEKRLMPKGRLLPQTGHLNEDRGKKSEDINHKDLKAQNKEENINAQKNKQYDKHLEQQRTGMLISHPEKHAIATGPQKLNKSNVEDRKMKETDGRRNKGVSNHGFQGDKVSLPPCPMSIREPKHGHSKEDDRKYEHIDSKSNRHRTEEKRKNKRGNLIEDKNSENERDSKETLQKMRGTIKMKDSAKEGKKVFLAEDNAKSVGGIEEHMPVKAGKDEEQSKSKDLKLSFMQKLNLTLSPAKKQTDKLKSGAKPTSKYDADTPSQEIALVQSVPLNSNSTKQTKTPSSLADDNPAQTKMEKITSAFENEMQIGNGVLTEAVSAELSATSFQQNIAGQYQLSEAKIEMEEVNETFVAPSLGSPMDQHTLPDSCFSDLETISSVDFDTFCVIDEINGSDSDSLMDEGQVSKCADKEVLVDPEKGNRLVPHETAAEKARILSADMSETNPKVHNSEPSFSDHGNLPEALCDQGLKPTFEPRDTNPVLTEDENSILSVDLNQMRCIPKAISPLNSPMRPLPRVLRTESLYEGPVKGYNTESTIVCPGRSQSGEINKENQKPLHTDHPVLEESHLSMSSNELEEGEIVSDDGEAETEQNTEYSKTIKRKSSDRSDLSNSTSNHKAKSTSSGEDSGKLNSGKRSKEKPHGGTVKSSKEMKKNKAVSIDCLEKIVQIIIEPSTAHEFMNMMRAIRKQIRRNYMKFKIHFPVQHFHRIIDSAVLNFTSLVKYLDFSKMTKSNGTLKLDLCEVIESKLNQIKKNSAIEYLFKQQESDMKKKLWKLVDEQLDHLFDKIKKILLKLCNLKNFGNECSERKLDKRMNAGPKCLVNHKTDRQKSKKPILNVITKKPEDCTLSKPTAGSQLSKRDHCDINKPHTHKNTTTKSKRSYTDNAKYSETNTGLLKERSIENTSLKAGKYEKEESQMVGDPHKSDISSGPLTEQQMSGLTFNLVNDAQMGEMFKSLLQGSDLSEKNVDFIDEHQWEFRTPVKHTPEDQSCEEDTVYEAEESVPKNSHIESRVLDGIKWPTVSPERDSTFLTRLHMPVDPDILDESCMFEIPTDQALKKGEICISEKPKSLVSSILLEDLAVSLTIPSPLKSDAHLSFLKPDVLGSVPEDVLSAHFSEDAHLEEEDVSEQDIHLALESDNSSSKSSCSSSWATMPTAPGFQYCPNLPMQAVIMEKSNDHFIVKIRRAAPSTSPNLDQSTDEPLASLAENGSNEIMSEEKCDTSDSKSIALEDKMTTENSVNIVDSEDGNHTGEKQVSGSPEFVKEISVYLENGQESVQSKPSVPNDVIVSKETWCSKSRPCNMFELLKEPYSNSGEIEDHYLLGSHQGLHSDAGQEITSDLQDPSKELKGSLKESSSKTSQHEETPEMFKLPEMHTVKVLGGESVLSAKECSTISPVAVPLAEELSSKSHCHFDICIDMTDDTPMENEVDSWNLTGQSAVNDIPRSLYKDKKELKAEVYGEAFHISEQAGNLIGLPDKPEICGNAETKTLTNNSGQWCEENLDKESKKRKKETEETASVKRQKKESNPLACKKNSKSNKKSQEITSVGKSASDKKAASTRDKDAPLSTLSKSASNLCAKNIIKKKGEVVISWTRNDDREILLECQKKGPSEKTFASVATRLNKNPAQVEERFRQLVKLFKMSNCS
ncbi:CASP8-associated protein 2 isoform X2 [Pogona vitticeps]